MSTTASTIILYGIKNCDKIKKAQQWLNSNQITFQFHDYRKDGIDQPLIDRFAEQLGWENLINKRGTTYRQLDEQLKTHLDQEKTLALLINYPAMIKRPVLQISDQYFLDFSAQRYQDIFNK